MPALIKLSDVSFAFPGKPWLLRDLNLSIQPGEFVGIVGATGSGKSTLLHLMCGVIPHFIKGQLEGRVELRGQDTRGLSLGKIARHIGVVGQDPENQLFNLMVKDEVAWALENRGVDPALMDDRVNAVLDFMHIRHLKERVTYDLSGGEKQRLVLAATYVAEPEILFLDNPVSMLDPVGAEMFIESLREILDRGQTVVMIEDKIDELAEFADRIVVLDRGTIVVDCPARELGAHVNTLLAANIRPPRLLEFRHRLQAELGLRVPAPANGRESAAAFQSVLRPRLDLERAAPPAKPERSPDPLDFIRVEGLDFSYTHPRRVVALRDISFRLGEASFAAIVGQNGSGKTTLSRCMSGYLRPSRGRTMIGGLDVTRLSVRRRAEIVGYVFQNPDHQIFLDPVLKDVEFGPRNLRWPAERVRQRTETVLKKLGLWELREVHPYRLSKGNRQRVAIASVAVMEPKVLIVDEPNTGQDPYQARAIMDLLRNLRDELGTTVIVVTHAMELVAEYCDRTLVLLEGKLLLDGPTRDVMAQPDILRQTRVQPPPITRLALGMGWTPPPLTVEEAVQRLASASPSGPEPAASP